MAPLRPLGTDRATPRASPRRAPSSPTSSPPAPDGDDDDDDDERTLASPADVSRSSTHPNNSSSLSGLVKRRRKRVPLEPLNANAAPDVNLARWMSSLPDEAKLDELYLPGTHESLALHFPLLPSICQSTSLTSQLRGGIRFLDLRFALLDDGTLWAYHGVVPQRRRAEDVFDEVYAWLEGEGARECVVVSCKQENPAPLFAPTLWSLLDRSSRSRSKWHDEDRWPALEEVRGKCVMFCRFGWDDRRGLHPPTWPNDSRAAWRTSIGGRDTVVQDWYGLSSPLALPRKASLALSLFDPSYSSLLPSPSPSPSDDQPPRLPHRISFLSCASFPLLYPSLAAKGFGLPSLGLGWRGVNDLVLRGLRRLALRDARLDGESGDETVKGDGRKGRGRRYEVGQGGMVLLLDFWECPAGGAGRNGRGGQEQRSSALVEELVRMNFA